MDYVGWCGDVLQRIIGAGATIPHARTYGISTHELVQLVFGDASTDDHQLLAVVDAARGLAAAGFLTSVEGGGNPRWKVTLENRELANDPTPVWEAICRQKLQPEHVQLLAAVNRLSPRVQSTGQLLTWVEHQTYAPELGVWAGEFGQVVAAAQELRDLDLLSIHPALSRHHLRLRSTYQGLVWETRRAFTMEARFLDGLVAEWETTSVDFKRELRVDTADEKAEFVKDVLGLANTQASGRRWLVVGFDDKTRAYHGPPDPRITQNRLEQLLAAYTAPVVAVRYAAVDYPAGQVGKLEVLRTPAHLPYAVAKSVGDKKKIKAGDVFVRHGSQTEQPTPAELQALKDEAARAVRA